MSQPLSQTEKTPLEQAEEELRLGSQVGAAETTDQPLLGSQQEKQAVTSSQVEGGGSGEEVVGNLSQGLSQKTEQAGDAAKSTATTVTEKLSGMLHKVADTIAGTAGSQPSSQHQES
jgi:hypothetical protein